MITIAVANSKGGVGKTTLAAALAVRATQEHGARVCLIDLDPQQSLAEWWKRRSKSDNSKNPMILEVWIAPSKPSNVPREGFDWCFLDGPPAFLTTVEEMISAADFTLIPIKPSVADVLGAEDTVVLAREAGAAYLCVFNDVGATERVVDKAREFLFSHDVPIAAQPIIHRVSHILGMNAGKTAATVNAGWGRWD